MRNIGIKIITLALSLAIIVAVVTACSAKVEVPGASSEPESKAGEYSEAGSFDDSGDTSLVSGADISGEPASQGGGEESSSESSGTVSAVEQSGGEVSADVSSVAEPVSEDSGDDSSEAEQSVADTSGEYFPPAEGKVIAFTFDDGPSYVTDMVLDLCEEKGIAVTFFVVGDRIGSENKARIQRAVSLGCEVGNHSYDHSSYTSISTSAALEDQIGRTNEIIKSCIGRYPTLMRPPYGNFSKSLAEQAGMSVIMWSVDTLDWKSKNTDTIIEYTYPQISSGDIVLMHDLYETTYKAFESLVDTLLGEGYKFVTVSELLGSEKLADKTFFHGFGY